MKKTKVLLALACTILLATGCGETAATESKDVESKTEVAENVVAESEEAEVETEVAAGTEETDMIEYVALEGDGTGFATETVSNITYSIPDTWTKNDSNVIWYRDTDNGGIMYVSAESLAGIDDIDMQNMMVDAALRGIKKYDGYSDWGTNEGTLKYGNKAVSTLYTYTDDGNTYVGEAMIFNDLESVVSIVYTIPMEDMNDECLSVVANDIFASIELINTP